MNKINLPSSVIKSIFQKLAIIVKENPVVPVLSNALVSVRADHIHFEASDLERTISIKHPYMGIDKFDFCLPIKMIYETMKTLGEEEVDITYDSKNLSCVLKTKKGKFNISLDSVDDFPKNNLPEDKTYTFEYGEISEAISKTSTFVGQDEIRIALTGVCIDLDKDNITFAATDANMMSLFKMNKDDTGLEKIRSLVPGKSLALFEKIFDKDNGPVSVYADKVDFYIFNENIFFKIRKIDATYPDISGIIPKYENEIRFNRTDILHALKRVSLFSNGSTRMIVLKFVNNTLNIQGADLDFGREATETLSCEYDSEFEGYIVGFNVDKLAHVISKTGGDECIFKTLKPNMASAFFEESEEKNHISVVMPLMVNN